ncbi:polysaccharide deacetylase family protein [Aquimarina sp. TRL1]|uniref:polysaccharide deacetylase family protein n=1 Tax=Aquimarina sp. (strain TRL1) TaxID=2736252 RepID=UPI0015890CEA|nr:polysaccharide deacetylase family protein [Aquimarina sp. TRL1]QKX04752.1 polysaccharide deacetylase family protein [Aquimarina sp. TRL1]
MYRILCIGSLFLLQSLAAQKNFVSITIDDVPNIQLLEKTNFSSELLRKIDSMQLPVAIFINEGFLYQNKNYHQNYNQLVQWITNKNVTSGNHTYGHTAYEQYSSFTEDIIKGAVITKEVLAQQEDSLKYFRFPYNNLGKDSISQKKMAHFLSRKGYTITPFTIESEDWLFNTLYENALQKKDFKNARYIGDTYLSYTLNVFEYHQKLSQDQYKRNIRHIFLCHDNVLNTDYLPKIIKHLQSKEYRFISIKEALEDPVYSSKNTYYKKWGISWMYRWIQDPKKRSKLLKAAPDNKEMNKMYNQLLESH